MAILKKISLLTMLLILGTSLWAQNPNENYNRFKQLTEELPSPNSYRNGSGQPGHEYFQQQADYVIEIELNEKKDVLSGSETITYHNNSPDALEYLWLQLDQNVRAPHADSKTTKATGINPNYIDQSMAYAKRYADYEFDGGFHITKVTDFLDNDIDYTINKTMMRINLDQPLASGASYTFNVDFWYNINDRMQIGGRSGYEYFPEDDNKLYTIAQFYPRMAVYDDVNGWQNKQFLGQGEFALSFGNFDVKITVPADHVVGATGTLQNPKKLMSKKQYKRLKKSYKTYDDPLIIVTEEEARKAERSKSLSKKTWHYKAENVRDFGFASSRKFIWDAMAVKMSDGSSVMAMSLYPKEGNPLWEEYSTRAVAHTLNEFSRYTFDYPYPVAYSVHAAAIGMEYPMICFNFGRPDKDGNYTDQVKYNMLGVIIHEIGHNYFPMIVNSDERQWAWLDEGITSFVQYLAERTFDPEFQHWFGPASTITGYMAGDKEYMTPIMTDSDNIRDFQYGNNSYGKPAAGLNILREYIMGPELFDQALQTYSQRWMFKHPAPADFFRTMEDASGVDLDWFWRAWFYTTDHVDLSIDEVRKIDLGGEDNVYQLKFKNNGGIPLPIMMELTYADGSTEEVKYPAEVWKVTDEFNKVLIVEKEITSITVDPKKVTTDIDIKNNTWPAKDSSDSRFDKYKNKNED